MQGGARTRTGAYWVVREDGGSQRQRSRWPLISGSGMKGFTFIEVILALTLFSFGLLAITGMFGVSTQALQSGSDRTKAVLLAQEKLEQLKDLPYHHIIFTPNDQDPADLLHTDRENHGPIQLSWSVEKDRPMAGLSVLTVQAIWRASGGQIKSVKFVTLRTDFGEE